MLCSYILKKLKGGFLMTKDKRKIRNAKDVLAKYNLLRKLPIDVEYICKKENIDIQIDDLAELEEKYGYEVSGLISLDKEKGIRAIFVNQKDTIPRQKFTIAHELGHYFLHYEEAEDGEKDGAFISFRGSKGKKETEANKFARDLLMPEELVRAEHLKSFVPTSDYLANIFGVSVASMKIRLEELELDYVF